MRWMKKVALESASLLTMASKVPAYRKKDCEMHACDVPVPAHGGLASERVERRCNDCKS